jgi:hypothetical protein
MAVLGRNVVTTCFHYLLFILKLELAVIIHFNYSDLVIRRNELKQSVNRSMLLYATLPLANIIAEDFFYMIAIGFGRKQL